MPLGELGEYVDPIITEGGLVHAEHVGASLDQLPLVHVLKAELP